MERLLVSAKNPEHLPRNSGVYPSSFYCPYEVSMEKIKMHNTHHDETERNTEIKRAESDKTYDIYLFFGTPGLWFDNPPFSL